MQTLASGPPIGTMAWNKPAATANSNADESSSARLDLRADAIHRDEFALARAGEELARADVGRLAAAAAGDIYRASGGGSSAGANPAPESVRDCRTVHGGCRAGSAAAHPQPGAAGLRHASGGELSGVGRGHDADHDPSAGLW